MLDKILNDIEFNREELINGLLEFVRLESSDTKSTKAQTFVEKELKEMGFEVDCFRGVDERCLDLADYCKPDIIYDENAYNVAGYKKGNNNHPSLMLFGHIDTEKEDYFGCFEDPYASYVEDGKIYGLGASDDKGGIAMMLYAMKYVLKHQKELPFDVTLLSILGKHGGAFGTLSALMKGYRGDYSIYLHPAETGHGFAEVKNISLGAVDLDIEVKGKPARLHDDLDPGVNANILASYLIGWLEELNQKNRKNQLFDFGSFMNEPSYILNIGSVEGKSGYGGVCQKATLKLRIRFFKPHTINSIIEDVKTFIFNKCQETKLIDYNDIIINKASFNASPAMVDTNDAFVKMIENNITSITGIDEFIHQYHGGSDIRLPILYGNSQCVGIGPTCVLPLENEGKREWNSIDDYIQGIKILASIIYSFKDFKRD